MKKCPKCNEIFRDFAGVYPDTCPKCKVDLDTGLKISENTEDKKPKSGINMIKKIIAFILDLIIAYILFAIINLILYRGLVVLGQFAPSTREGILAFMKIFFNHTLFEITGIILIILYFKISPKLMGKTLGKKIFRI